MAKTLDKWIKNGEHLPPILRDFHDQKDFFKLISMKVTARRKQNEAEGRPDHIYEGFDWVRFHIFTIDFFLWFMALNGYTLQRSRKKFEFRDYAETIRKSKEDWVEGYPLHLEQLASADKADP